MNFVVLCKEIKERNFFKSEIFLNKTSPELPDAACGVFPRPLVCHNHELNLVPDLEDLPALHLGHVEEELLPLLLLVREESKLTCNRNKLEE